MTSRAAAIAMVLALVGCGHARSAAEPPPASASPTLLAVRHEAPGLHFVDLPGVRGKVTVVEQARGLALIEVPLSDLGAEATKLVDDVEGARRVLAALDARFPGKPVTTVLSSHWHPHSLGGLRPFFDRGVRLVTTRASFARLREMLGASAESAPSKLVTFVEGDALSIGDGDDTIVAHRFTHGDYPSTPTEDYLYFELPKYGALFASCMFYTMKAPPVGGRALVSRREEDLFRFVRARNLHPRWLLRIDREAGRSSELVPFAELESRVANGLTMSELAGRYRAISTEALARDRARLVAEALRDRIPASVFNDLVYECLEQRRLARAVELAMLQATIAPSDANSWDTLGEAEYAAGAVEAARAHEDEARRRSKGAYSGGEAAWKRDLAQYEAAWAKAGIGAPAP